MAQISKTNETNTMANVKTYKRILTLVLHMFSTLAQIIHKSHSLQIGSQYYGFIGSIFYSTFILVCIVLKGT